MIPSNYSWLKSVNNLLENLDSGVEHAVENQAEKYEEIYDDDDVGGQSSVDDILAKRGLLIENASDDEKVEEMEEEEQEIDDQVVDSFDQDFDQGFEQQQQEQDFSENVTEHHDNMHTQDEIGSDNLGAEEDVEDGTSSSHHTDGEEVKEETIEDEETEKQSTQSTDNDENAENISGNIDDGNDAAEIDEQEGDEPTASAPSPQNSALKAQIDKIKKINQQAASPSPDTLSAQNEALRDQIDALKKGLEAQKKLTKDAVTEKNNATKETRKLRRNLVKLNAELDSAERELDAQRTELERAATRIEKDREKYKEEKEKMETEHKQDLKTLTEEHKTAIQTMVDSHAKQISDMEDRIERAEEARLVEGDDLSKELADATERERETLKKVFALEEEKSTYISEISSLKTQIKGLESRTEVLQQASESASEQEREADDRLDAALSLHARQLGQRQAREAELERTIADLSAALVAARNRETSNASDNNERATLGANSAIAELKDKLLSAKDEVELLSNQLMMEQQKSQTFQNELEDMTREQAEETAETIKMQKDYEHKVSELTNTVARLQSSLSKYTHGSSAGESSSESGLMTKKLQKQVSQLSEDLVRQKAKLQNSTTEVQTLKNRLRSAQSRAEVAEKAAQAQVFDIESNSFGRGARQRNFGKKNKVISIKSALNLESGSGEARETLGKIVDIIDMIAVDLGSYFRSDPFARLFFLIYLIILHLWAFCLIIFHAHRLEPSPDIGPEQLLKHSYRHIEQAKIP